MIRAGGTARRSSAETAPTGRPNVPTPANRFADAGSSPNTPPKSHRGTLQTIHRPHQRMLDKLTLRPIRPQRPALVVPTPPRLVSDLDSVHVTVDHSPNLTASP